VNELTTAQALLAGVVLVIATVSALTWRESRWEQRASARQRDRTPSRGVPRESRRSSSIGASSPPWIPRGRTLARVVFGALETEWEARARRARLRRRLRP